MIPLPTLILIVLVMVLLIYSLIATIFDFGERERQRRIEVELKKCTEEYERQMQELEAKEQQKIQNNTQINIIYLDFTKKK